MTENREVFFKTLTQGRCGTFIAVLLISNVLLTVKIKLGIMIL